MCAAIAVLLLAACGSEAQVTPAPTPTPTATLTPTPTPKPTPKPTAFVMTASNGTHFIVFSRDATAMVGKNTLEAFGYTARAIPDTEIPKNAFAVCMGPGDVFHTVFVADDGSAGTASTNAAQAFCDQVGWK